MIIGFVKQPQGWRILFRMYQNGNSLNLRGSCCIKIKQLINDIERSKWIVDDDIPIFVNEGRDYIEQRFKDD